MRKKGFDPLTDQMHAHWNVHWTVEEKVHPEVHKLKQLLSQAITVPSKSSLPASKAMEVPFSAHEILEHIRSTAFLNQLFRQDDPGFWELIIDSQRWDVLVGLLEIHPSAVCFEKRVAGDAFLHDGNKLKPSLSGVSMGDYMLYRFHPRAMPSVMLAWYQGQSPEALGLNASQYQDALFHHACYRGHVPLIQWLLKEGVDPEKRNRSGTHPFDLFIEGHMERMGWLMHQVKEMGQEEVERLEFEQTSAREILRHFHEAGLNLHEGHRPESLWRLMFMQHVSVLRSDINPNSEGFKIHYETFVRGLMTWGRVLEGLGLKASEFKSEEGENLLQKGVTWTGVEALMEVFEWLVDEGVDPSEKNKRGHDLKEHARDVSQGQFLQITLDTDLLMARFEKRILSQSVDKAQKPSLKLNL